MSHPMDSLQRELVKEFERDPRGARVARILGEYAERHDDWKRYAMFDADCYTRNLVERNEHYEMLVLCWNVGQKSPIHNHAGQNCWMGVLEGEIEETLFTPSVESGEGPLIEGKSRVYTRGRVGFINDDVALHRVRPVAGHRGISLHLYSKPIDECLVYDETTGRVVSSRLVYHSIDGAMTGAVGKLERSQPSRSP